MSLKNIDNLFFMSSYYVADTEGGLRLSLHKKYSRNISWSSLKLSIRNYQKLARPTIAIRPFLLLQ